MQRRTEGPPSRTCGAGAGIGPSAEPLSDRFARHRRIPGWDQGRLTGATLVVAGMGALGNEVTRILAMTGVGRLILCDPDRIEPSNLSRTLLFRDRDVGCLKVEAAAAALRELAPGVQVDPRPRSLVQGVGLAELRDAALVLGCLDNRRARLQLAGRCGLVRAPSIDGGTHPWGGEVRLHLNPDGPCYGCSLTAAERAVDDTPWSCTSQTPLPAEGTAAPSSALVGAWMALFAVRHLLGSSTPPGILRLDGGRGSAGMLAQRRDPECPYHQPLDFPLRRVSLGSADRVADLRALIAPGEQPLLWDGVQYGLQCRVCGFTATAWQLPAPAACPACGRPAVPKQTLELMEAPAGALLADLGVPPREILPVRSADGFYLLELMG